MDKCREAFERYQADLTGTNYEELKEHFDDCEKCYGTRYYIDSTYRAEWEVWKKAWQEQQKRIDELQARVDAQKKHIEMALIAVKDIHKSALDEFNEWDVLKEQAPKLCEHLQNLSVAVGELEQALKGGEV